jgi:hypothetical protein
VEEKSFGREAQPMSRVYVMVEGQTEEAFIRELLAPHFAGVGLYLSPIIVSTSPGFKGGVVSYAKVRPQLLRLCKQDSDAYVTTLFDLYALPNDFPGRSAGGYPENGSGEQKAVFLEGELAIDIGQRNFLPNLMVHEFEALLFAQPEQFQVWVDGEKIVMKLQKIRDEYPGPEDINDGPKTAPSKRIKAVMPAYQKTFHGPLIACDIGLDVMRDACPHFNAWLIRLESMRNGKP